MTPLAPQITAFLRERLPHERRASVHTCDTYAHAFRLLFKYAVTQLKVTPSRYTWSTSTPHSCWRS
jgi:hypothetical protein